MTVDIDKIDINILYFLVTTNKTDSMYSAKTGAIQEYFEYPISYYTIVRRMQKLLEKGYVIEGFKSSNARTYYISEKGITFMQENILNKENIYEEIDENEENESEE